MGLLLVLPLLGGCYSYAPARMGEVAPGASVRVHVDEATGRELAELTGRSAAVGAVEGEVLRAEQDHLFVALTVGMAEVGARRERLRQQVRLSSEQVVHLEVREMDGLRTGFAAAGAGVGAAVILIRLIGGESGGTPGGRPPGPQDARIP